MNINTIDISNMTINQITSMIYSLQYEIEEKNRMLSESIPFESINKCAFTIEMVSILHNINPHTIRKYVEMGYLQKHPESTDKRILIWASDALKLNFKNIKKECRDFGKNINRSDA